MGKAFARRTDDIADLKKHPYFFVLSESLFPDKERQCILAFQ